MEDRKTLCEQIAQLGEAGYKFIEGATAAILLMQREKTEPEGSPASAED